MSDLFDNANYYFSYNSSLLCNQDGSLPDGIEDDLMDQDTELVLIDGGAYGSEETWEYRGVTILSDDVASTITYNGKRIEFKTLKEAEDFIKSVTPNYTNPAFIERLRRKNEQENSKFVLPTFSTGQEKDDPKYIKYLGRMICYDGKTGKFVSTLDTDKEYEKLSDVAKAIEDASIKWK